MRYTRRTRQWNCRSVLLPRQRTTKRGKRRRPAGRGCLRGAAHPPFPSCLAVRLGPRSTRRSFGIEPVVGLDATQGNQARRVQVLRRRHDGAAAGQPQRGRRPERLRQIEHRRCGALGDGRELRPPIARRSPHRRHLQRFHFAPSHLARRRRVAVRQPRCAGRRQVQRLCGDRHPPRSRARFAIRLQLERHPLPPPRHRRRLSRHRLRAAQLFDHRTGHDLRTRRGEAGRPAQLLGGSRRRLQVQGTPARDAQPHPPHGGEPRAPRRHPRRTRPPVGAPEAPSQCRGTLPQAEGRGTPPRRRTAGAAHQGRRGKSAREQRRGEGARSSPGRSLERSPSAGHRHRKAPRRPRRAGTGSERRASGQVPSGQHRRPTRAGHRVRPPAHPRTAGGDADPRRPAAGNQRPAGSGRRPHRRHRRATGENAAAVGAGQGQRRERGAKPRSRRSAGAFPTSRVGRLHAPCQRQRQRTPSLRRPGQSRRRRQQPPPSAPGQTGTRAGPAGRRRHRRDRRTASPSQK